MDNILYKIKSEYDNFSKMHRKFADYILDNSESAILMPLSKLSKSSGVSEATIIRFTYVLGFDGYRDFQKSLLDSIKYSITTIDRMKVTGDLETSELIRNQVNKDLTDINNTFSGINTEDLVKAASIIDKGSKIYILGLRTSYILAQYLAHYLKMMRFNVFIVESTMMEPYEQLINMTEDDVLVSLSFPRYSQRTIESTKLIKEKNIPVISITDSENSPISRFSDINLTAVYGLSSFIDSLVGPMALINALLISIADISTKDVKESFSKLESYWERSDTYEKI